jgi:hypothetical protein
MAGCGSQISRVLRTPGVIVVSIVLFAIYMVFDLREGGRTANLKTTELATLPAYVKHFGGWYVAGMIGLNLALAVLGAVLVVQSYRLLKARRAAARTGACTVGASLLIGFSAFACPGCPLPLLATLGTAFFATSLPLYGLEFKVLALLLNVGALFWLTRSRRRVAGDAAVTAPA